MPFGPTDLWEYAVELPGPTAQVSRLPAPTLVQVVEALNISNSVQEQLAKLTDDGSRHKDPEEEEEPGKRQVRYTVVDCAGTLNYLLEIEPRGLADVGGFLVLEKTAQIHRGVVVVHPKDVRVAQQGSGVDQDALKQRFAQLLGT